MTVHAIIRHKKARAALGGVLVAWLGWQLGWLPAGRPLDRVSYDLPFVFTAPGAPTNIVLVELDEVSFADLHQTYESERWDRRLHAQLLDYLRADGASLVVFDMVFTDAGPDAAADRELAQAIQAQGRVVLAADLENHRSKGIVGLHIWPPHEVFRAATTNWGPTQAEIEDDGAVRKIFGGTEQKPAMTWVAAALANPALRLTGADHLAPRWVRYYGPGGTLPRVSYSEAAHQPAGFYRGKTVFIGGRPKTRFAGDEVDEFFTPWRRLGHPQISGLELTATEFLNLSRGDFLTRLPAGWEFLLLAGLGILAGAGLASVRPWRAVLLAGVAALAVVALAVALFFNGHVWFVWGVAALVQIPCALAWSLGWQWRQLKKEKDWLEAPLPDLWDETPAAPGSSPSLVLAPAAVNFGDTNAAGLPAIPDHELLRLVGRGAYGDVWLARDVLGSFHAVKIIRRAAFDHADPYDREFRGLQKFTPISRAHPGLVHILHVGRNQVADCFYYVMEAGDDEKSGARIDPATYSARNLGRDLHRRAPLPVEECVDLGAALCDALEFLHGQGLIHRDLKPANIIFVNGRPKLADIGLVTEIGRRRHQVSQVGTEGYLPPEGPGTAVGDLFALGKVLAEMIEPQRLGEAGQVSAEAASKADDPALEKFRAVIATACAENPGARFASAGALRAALLKVLSAI